MATKNTTAPRLEVRGIRKTFGQNAVLKGINLSVDAGEVVALIGGNGAGKSTLMKIIMGIYTCDEGDILIDGQAVKLGKPAASLAQGIYLVPQEPMLFPNMTVLENILMGFSENEGELKKRLNECMKELNFDLNLQRKANTLSIAEQQLVELLRGMMRNARILILDEPTSSLTFNEVQSLFKTVEDLKKKGIAIIYITHRLTEVFEIATHVAIMRDGVITLEGPVGNFTKEMLIQGLLPNDAQGAQQTEKAYVPVDYAHLKPVMQVKDFSGYGFSNITFDLYPGEILGIAGVVGAGRTELISTIFGRDKTLGGKVILDGRDITGLPTKKVLEAGHQLRAGRPPLPRHFQNPLDFFQHDLRAAQRQGRRRGEHGSPPSGRNRAEIRQGFQNEDRFARGSDRQPLRRQPAEGGHCPRAVHESEGRHSR